MAPAGDPWTCPSRKCHVSTLSLCRERALEAHDLPLRGLADQVIEALGNIDARLIRSIRCLRTRPGIPTLAYLREERKPYLLPLPLFLVANLVFFGVQSLTSSNVFSAPLDGHLHNQMWSDIAQGLVTHRLVAGRSTLDLYAPIFNQAVLLNAKTLLILIVPSFAALLPILFYRSRMPPHLYAFLLLLFCVALGIAEFDVLLLGGAGLDSVPFDHTVSIALLVATALSISAPQREWFIA